MLRELLEWAESFTVAALLVAAVVLVVYECAPIVIAVVRGLRG